MAHDALGPAGLAGEGLCIRAAAAVAAQRSRAAITGSGGIWFHGHSQDGGPRSVYRALKNSTNAVFPIRACPR
ncbi:MAG: hypothetical protein OXC41_08080 [Gammaproteobacteria bacterium]|nr:hypothetical protein [Gammaproteobacteria bacterium]